LRERLREKRVARSSWVDMVDAGELVKELGEAADFVRMLNFSWECSIPCCDVLL
jgi:hypothetical protein